MQQNFAKKVWQKEKAPILFVSVQVLVAGRLVHSRSRGDGLVDSQAKISNILSAVATALQLHS